jgi:hypothetical protein
LQVAQRYYEGTALRIAKKCLDARMDNNHDDGELTHQADTEKTKNNLAGKYQLTLVGLDYNGLFMDHLVSSNNLKLPLKFICGLLVFTASKFNLHGMKIFIC